jgi:zinc transport system substrate-binding protein
MKKYFSLILITLVTILLLTSCSEKPVQKASESFSIVTSFYPIYIFTLNIAKDVPGVQVTNLTKPTTGCLHDYQLTPNDLITLEKADVFVINGLGMESFMEKVISQQPNLKIIDSSIGIEILDNNPHIWVSISNAIAQVKNISEQLISIDPMHAKQYKKNAEAYVKKLETKRTKMHAALDRFKGKSIITFHEAFPYFAKEFGLNIIGVVEREPGSEPNAAELSDTIELITKTNTKTIFVEPQYPQISAHTIAEETGAKVYTLDPVVTGLGNENDYIQIMDSNLKTLVKAFKE